MQATDNSRLPIPTNIITGFLGVGKTTAILNLLKNKPDGERWAVLVNEFGEVGIDGNLFQSQHSQEQGVFIREVPGGCMCCASGLPIQMALNLLLSHAKPQRLLIEPTGLGHPVEVLQLLSEKYKNVLAVEKILTLVDARKFSDARYTEHETFNQQIAIADIVVANKKDLCGDDDFEILKKYLLESSKKNAELVFAEQGAISLDLLLGETQAQAGHSHHHHHHDNESQADFNEMPYPEIGYLKVENQGEGYKSAGWRFSAQKIFDYNKLFSFLSGVQAERVKGVFVTQQGAYTYNISADALKEVSIAEADESRVEIIAKELEESWQHDLLACLIK